MDLDALGGALARLSAGTSTELDTVVLVHDLRDSRLRDAVLATAVGYTRAGESILHGRSTDTAWLIDGPLDGAAIARSIHLVRRLHEDARLAHSPATANAAAVLAYLEWVSGHPIRALQMLREHPAHGLGGLLRDRIALGAPTPVVLAPTAAGGRR